MKNGALALALFAAACVGAPAVSIEDEPLALLPSEVAIAQQTLERKVARLKERGPKPMNKPDLAADYFVEQRLAPGADRIPVEHLASVREELRQRQALQSNAPGVAGPGGIRSWDWLGPGNIGGRTRAMVIDPGDPDTMYAAGVAGGIWKSEDAGATWDVADDFMLNLAVCSLAIDPNNARVLYAGTGEGFFFSPSFVQGLGIFKSSDGGATWTQLTGTVSGVPVGAFDYVNKIVISPNNSSRIYAATRTGVWRSTDAGVTWSVVLANPLFVSGPQSTVGCNVGCTDLVVRQDRDPDVLFAAFGSSQSDGLYRSDDGGATWLQYTVGANQGRMTLALAPSNNDILYLMMADNGSVGALGQLVGVFRSDDGGASFTSQVDFGTLIGPWLLSNLILATGCYLGFPPYSQGWYDNIIAVDPADPDIVWVGGVDIFRSDDAGVTWGIAGYSIFTGVTPQLPFSIHPDHHLFVFHPDYDGVTNQTMYAGNDGGIYRTDNARAATSIEDCPIPPDDPLPSIVWENVNNGYGVTQFYHGDSAKDRDLFIGGCQDNGTNRVGAADRPNRWDRVFGGDGGYVAIDPRDSDVIYLEIQGFPTMQKSIDGGQTFNEVIEGITDTDGIFITPFAMDQENPDVLWTGGSRVWRTQDGAASWQVVSQDFAGPNQISAIGISPADGNVVYLGYTNGYVVRSTDALAPSPTWEILFNGLIGATVSSVAVDRNDPDVAYVTYSNYGIPHVLKTEDGGQFWFSIDGIGFTGVPDIPVHWIEIRPCDSEQLYVGTELGIFASDDGGATWLPSNLGLANTVVESLDFQDRDTLVAFTHGRGAFRALLHPCPSRPPSDPELDPVPGVKFRR